MHKKKIEDVSPEDQEEIIQNKFDEYSFKDPYPEILPSLLNPIDIEKYIHKTGMISPFIKKNLKTVTYRVPLYGDIHYWENNERKIKELNENIDDVFELKPNAIIYIHISTTFRVPYYIAFRFNLKIDLVHKGLLLGTGPVVDPGFQGRIMIPIHNLTANKYTLRAGDGLIWVEFTKLSPYEDNVKEPPTKFDSLIKHTANDYFHSANHMQKIESAIPDAMNSAKKDAETAKKTVTLLSWGATLVVLLTVAGITIAGYTLLANVITPTISLIDTQKNQLVKNSTEIKELQETVKELQNKIMLENKDEK